MNEKLLNQIHHMDCLELLAQVEDKSIDCVLIDPPYEVLETEWDKKPVLDTLWYELKRIVKPDSAIIITAKPPFSSELILSNRKMYRYTWYFEKSRGANVSQTGFRPLMVVEEALIFSHLPAVYSENGTMRYYPQKEKLIKPYKREHKPDHQKITGNSKGSPMRNPERGIGVFVHEELEPRNLIYSPDDTERGMHPTQKSSQLFEYFLKTFTLEGDTVLDCFSGSGTTAIACLNLGRSFICGDSSQEYVELSRERIARHNPAEDSPLKGGGKQLSLLKLLGDTE